MIDLMIRARQGLLSLSVPPRILLRLPPLRRGSKNLTAIPASRKELQREGGRDAHERTRSTRKDCVCYPKARHTHRPSGACPHPHAYVLSCLLPQRRSPRAYAQTHGHPPQTSDAHTLARTSAFQVHCRAGDGCACDVTGGATRVCDQGVRPGGETRAWNL